MELYAYRGNFFEQKIWEVAWLFRGFLGKISLKNKLFQNIFVFSESAWRADLKNVLIFFIVMNFGNCKQTADYTEMSYLGWHVNFDSWHVCRHKTGIKIIVVHSSANFSDFKRFTKSAVARPTGLDTTCSQLLHGVEIKTFQKIPWDGCQRPRKNVQSLPKIPYFSTLNLSTGHYGLRRSKLLVGDYERLLMKGFR